MGNRKKLSRHGSVEIFDGAYNLTVPNKLSRHASTTKLEEVHTDHIKITGECEDDSKISKSEEIEEIKDNKPKINSFDVTVTNGKAEENSSDIVSIRNPVKRLSTQEESSTVNKSSTFQQSSSVQESSSVQQNQSFKHSSSVQESVSVQNSSSVQHQTIVQQQSTVKSSQVEQQTNQIVSQSHRSRQASGSNDTVVSGNRFNISNGLKRQSH